MNEQSRPNCSADAGGAATPKKRPKLKPSAKARKAKAMRRLIRLDVASPWLAQVRAHVDR